MIVAYFGALKQNEAMELKIEKFSSSKEGVYVVHTRSKDKKLCKFLIPRATTPGDTNFALPVEFYLSKLKEQLGKSSGRALWTGRGNSFVKQPLGKNMLFTVSHEIARLLGKPSVTEYTFHSFRRSAQQMVDVYQHGWHSNNVAQEYIMARRHAAAKTTPPKNINSHHQQQPSEQVQGHFISMTDSVLDTATDNVTVKLEAEPKAEPEEECAMETDRVYY